MLRLQACDGGQIAVPLALARQSQLIQNLIEEGCDDCVALAHQSCTHEVLARIFQIPIEFPAEGIVSLPNTVEPVETRDVETCLKILNAAMYLDMSSAICKLAKIPNLIHAVSAQGCADKVRALIEAKADTSAKNTDGKTAAELTTDENCLEELERGKLVALGYTPLMIEAQLGRTSRMLEILNTSDDVTASLSARSSCSYRRTALHIACLAGHATTVEALLQARAEPLAQDNHGWTALHLVAREGCLDIVTILLGAGAPHGAKLMEGRRIRDEAGETPLHVAAAAGQVAVMRALIGAGADVDARADTHACWWWETDVTPLDRAVQVPHSPPPFFTQLVSSTLPIAKNSTYRARVTSLSQPHFQASTKPLTHQHG